MPVSAEEISRRCDRFSQALRASGFRLTHQRLEVVRVLAASETHPDAEEVFRAVRERVPTISLDTVYRTLGTLADLGLASRVSGITGAARFDGNTDHHHHFICTRCDAIHDIESAELDALLPPGSASQHGQVGSVEVRFRGVCRECAPRDHA